MERKPYVSFFEVEEKDDKFSKEVTNILKFLRDNNFGNESSRKDLLDKLTSLHASSDPRSRKAFKAIGDLFSDIGDILIKYGQEN